MKMKKMILTVSSITAIAACSIATAQQQTDFNIYVYEDCKQVKKIQMSEHQIKAYTDLKQHEKEMQSLELPLKKMEKQLAVHERELDALSGELLIESEDRLVVNKALMKQHTQIAHKMEQVVAEHRADIHELERQARRIEKIAHQFEKAIQPSLGQYKSKDVQIQIGNTNINWDCNA